MLATNILNMVDVVRRVSGRGGSSVLDRGNGTASTLLPAKSNWQVYGSRAFGWSRHLLHGWL